MPFTNKICAQHVDVIFHPTNIRVEEIRYHSGALVRTLWKRELRDLTQWILDSWFVLNDLTRTFLSCPYGFCFDRGPIISAENNENISTLPRNFVTVMLPARFNQVRTNQWDKCQQWLCDRHSVTCFCWSSQPQNNNRRHNGPTPRPGRNTVLEPPGWGSMVSFLNAYVAS